MAFNCKILKDSVSPLGIRLTSLEITFPRFILSEFNTHRAVSKNSASSRAIPSWKQLLKLIEDPVIPVFGRNNKGMQSKSTDVNQETSEEEWLIARDNAMASVYNMSERLPRDKENWDKIKNFLVSRGISEDFLGNESLNIHKQWVNRLIEPFMWHTVIATGTDWNNLLALRCHPDCYTPDTEVLTKRGWKSFKDVSLGEEVYSLNIKTNDTEFVKVEKKISSFYEGKMLHIKGHSVDYITTPNHKHVASLGLDKKGYDLYSSKDLLNSKIVNLKKTNNLISGVVKDDFILPEVVKVSRNQHGNYKPIVIPEKKVPLRNLLRFLGYYLGDGWVNSSPKTNYVGICDGDLEKLSYYGEILKTLTESTVKITNLKRPASQILFQDKRLKNFLEPLGNVYTKKIPEWIWELDYTLLEELYKGLMDSDGSKDGRHFSTVSKELADDFQRLCLHLGISASISEIDRRGVLSTGLDKNRKPYSITTRKIYYCVSINKSKNSPVVKNYQKTSLSEIDYKGEVVCLRVCKNHTLYIRRKGKCVWSGNSQPEFYTIAHMMKNTMLNSKPTLLNVGEWHLPLILEDENDLDLETKQKISVARCARVSYLTHDGKRDLKEDLRLYSDLVEAVPMHFSPLEHVAMCTNSSEYSGNFRGWFQYRKLFPNENITVL